MSDSVEKSAMVELDSDDAASHAKLGELSSNTRSSGKKRRNSELETGKPPSADKETADVASALIVPKKRKPENK